MTKALKSGFSLIELVIVMAIIGIMMAITIPRIGSSKTADKQRDAVVSKLNELMSNAWKNAFASGKDQVIIFNIEQRTVNLLQTTGRTLSDNLPEGQSVPSSALIDHMEWPEQYRINNFFIEERDQMLQGSRDKIWFFVSPMGVAQQVIINFVDERASEENGFEVKDSLVLNPFYVQFKEYDEFQRP